MDGYAVPEMFVWVHAGMLTLLVGSFYWVLL